jgi:hypothetical protein
MVEGPRHSAAAFELARHKRNSEVSAAQLGEEIVLYSAKSLEAVGPAERNGVI